MSNNVVQLNEEIIKGQIKELVRGSAVMYRLKSEKLCGGEETVRGA